MISSDKINGCGMDPLFVPVSPCFRENVVVICKTGSFLCSLDNLLQKNVIVFVSFCFVCLFLFLFFLNQISKWHSFEKNDYF